MVTSPAALLALVLVLLLRQVQPAAAWQQKTPEVPAVQVAAPQAGEALQGLVTISGSTQVEDFQSAEISFGYQSDTTRTWFLLQQSSAGVTEGDLAQWDTTTIGDGTYRLRVQVFLSDGQVLEALVEGLRVRNYSPVETLTPAAGLPEPASQNIEGTLPTPTFTPLPDFQPPQRTPQVLPTNPARLTPADLRTSLIGGGGIVLAALLLAGIYAGLKSIFRR